MHPHSSSVQSLVTLQGPSDKLIQGEQAAQQFDLDQFRSDSLTSLGVKANTSIVSTGLHNLANKFAQLPLGGGVHEEQPSQLIDSDQFSLFKQPLDQQTNDWVCDFNQLQDNEDGQYANDYRTQNNCKYEVPGISLAFIEFKLSKCVFKSSNLFAALFNVEESSNYPQSAERNLVNQFDNLAPSDIYGNGGRLDNNAGKVRKQSEDGSSVSMSPSPFE